jgi:survival of motor neuron-related-splicing factor 30
MAIWRVDAKYYPAIVDQVLDDGTCTVIFDGYKTTEITQVEQLMPYNKNHMFNTKDFYTNKQSTGASQVGHKKAFTKKELELKLKEAKKRKKEKFVAKLKAMEEVSEKEKNKWKSFNNKLSSKTWKGVISKNKYETPIDHESKIGVGTNSLSNRLMSATGSIVLPPGANKSAAASASLVSKLSKTSQNYNKSN